MKRDRPSVRFTNVSKSFSWHRGHLLLREHFAWLFRGRRGDRFQALKHISFEVKQGESLAVLGHNGAGKSTLLGLIAGLAIPDEGQVEVNGRIAPLLELGSGFHPDLTGRENIYLNASLMGLSRKRTVEWMEVIIEFAGVRDFIDEPLRTYSSGMSMRLAFSIAVNLDPDILLIDEVLAVGDAAFQEKCYAKIREFRQAGKSMICVSHATTMISELCDTAIWLNHGELMTHGKIDAVIAEYAASRASISA